MRDELLWKHVIMTELDYGVGSERVVYMLHSVTERDVAPNYAFIYSDTRPKLSPIQFGIYTLHLYNETHRDFETISSQHETHECGLMQTDDNMDPLQCK